MEACDDYIETFTGGKFWFGERMPESDIRIADIAHALSLESRFGGHSKSMYTVAEHCCHVYDLYLSQGTSSQPGPLGALLHDAHEAYTKDIMKPLRRSPGMEGYNDICHRVQEAIEIRFGLGNLLQCQRELIKACDLSMLKAEAHELMWSRGTNWLWPEKMLGVSMTLRMWTPEQAKREFIDRFIGCC